MNQTTNGRAPRPRATDVDAQIGAYLRRHRVAKGWTQAQMADLIGVTYQQLHKYETGKNRLSAGALISLLRLLGVDLADFAAEIDERLPPPAIGPKMTATARRVHEGVARLNAAQQRVVLGVMEAMGPNAETARG